MYGLVDVTKAFGEMVSSPLPPVQILYWVRYHVSHSALGGPQTLKGQKYPLHISNQVNVALQP